MQHKELFVTGCDKNSEWMLEWFLENFRRHNKTPIAFSDFGVSESTKTWVRKNFDVYFEVPKIKLTGRTWFYKPSSLIKAPSIHKVWIDTDCQVLKPIDDIFSHLVMHKLSMVADRPWMRRRKEIWYNSGVVGVSYIPKILKKWDENCMKQKAVGDQEVLHLMLNEPLTKQIYINELHNKYNWLRLQLKDGEDSKDKCVIHWTGPKGKEKIRGMI